MARQEMLLQQENKGLVEKYKRFNRLSRNGALGVALGAAVVGVPFLIAPALIWAGVDQAQIIAIKKYQEWRNKGKEGKVPFNQVQQEKTIFGRIKDRILPSKGTIFTNNPKLKAA